VVRTASSSFALAQTLKDSFLKRTRLGFKVCVGEQRETIDLGEKFVTRFPQIDWVSHIIANRF